MGAARSIKGELRVEGSVSEISVLSGAVCGRVIEYERATSKTFVRISGFIAAVRRLGGRSVQTRGDTVSEATAIMELVVVEALRISNSLREATRKPPLGMSGKKKKSRELPARDHRFLRKASEKA